MTYNKILIVNLGGIGDILLSTPALRAIKKKFPASAIYFLGVNRTLEIANSLPYIDKTFGLHTRPSEFLENIKTLSYLRTRKIDLAVNMRTMTTRLSAFKIWLLLMIIGAEKKAGRNTEGRGSFFDIKIDEALVGIKSEMEYDIDLAESLGAQIEDRTIDLFINSREQQKIESMLEEKNITESDILIVIHPGGMPSRRWPVENYFKVIYEIAKRISCKFIITGDRGEIKLARGICKAGNVFNMTGRMNIFELAALIKKCSIFISGDTGPMHIAAILGVPQVAILGPGDLKRYDPRKISQKAIILYKKTNCSPCNRYNCDSKRCLNSIQPGEVVFNVLKLLDDKGKK